MKNSSPVFPVAPPPVPAPSLAEEIADLTRQIERLTWKRDFIFRVLAERPATEPTPLLLISPGQEATLRVLRTQAVRLAAEVSTQLSLQWGTDPAAELPLWLNLEIQEPGHAPMAQRFVFADAERLTDFLWHWCFESTMGIRYLAESPALYAQWEALRGQLPVPKPDSAA